MSDIANQSSIEHPTGSGIRINVITNRANGTDFNYSYLVRVPTKLTGKKRVRKQFPTLEKAKAFAEGQYHLSKRHGQATFNMTDEQRVDAVRALEILKGTKLTLEAAARYAHLRLQPDNGLYNVRDVADKILKTRLGMNLRPKTVKDFQNRIYKFCETFGDVSILEMQLNDVTEWIQSHSLSARTKRNYLVVIKSFFKWAYEENFIPDNPMEGITKRKLQEIVGKQDEKPPEIYTPNEAQLLLEAAVSEEIFPLMVIGFFCGLRTNELLSLKWEDIRPNENEPFVYVNALNAKSRSHRNVDLNKSTLEWLSLCDTGKGIIFNKVQQTYDEHRTKIHKKAGVEKRDNGLRHSFGSYHYGMYGDEIRTATQMGHNPNDHSLFSNYRALVSKADADAFWSIKVPSNNKELVQFPS